MKLCIHLLACIACLALPAATLAMEPLPSADLTSVDPVIGAPLKGLLDDYINVLPAQNWLSKLEDDGSFRSWSTHRDSLSKACQANPSACSPVLRAQFDTLSRELDKVDTRNGLKLRDAVLMSAMMDMCQVAGFLDMGNRCYKKQDLAAGASIGWYILGYDHLFLAYQDIDQDERGQMRSWLEREAKLSPEETALSLKRLERDKWSFERDAHAYELRDSESGAFSTWLLILANNITQSNHQGMLVSMANLARLAALQGQIEQAEQWWDFAQTLLAEHPELKGPNQGLLQSQRFFIDVELARRDGAAFNAPQHVQNLIDQNSPFTAQSLHYALYAVKEGQLAPALETLKRAQTACERMGNCGYSRKQQIKALIAIAQGQPATLQSLAQQWQIRLKHERLQNTEHRIVWALAERLRNSGANAEAAALYQALDEQIESWRTSEALVSTTTDFARYDDIKRMRVRMNVDFGNKVNIQETESLRGQSLLRQLRSQRWLKELAGEDDAEAKAVMERELAATYDFQQQLKQLSTDAPPLLRAVFQAIALNSEESASFARNKYLNKLAARKLKVSGDFIREPSALTTYTYTEDTNHFNALESSEAYLSWLRVPGGYVGTSLAVTPRDLINNRVGSSWNSIRQKFIPFTPQDEALLQLYRDLLQSGASINRGSKVTLSIETDRTGLMLNGLPIWQQTDGGFVTGKAAPPGGRRVKTFTNLSDALFERLLAPFAEHYQDSQRLIISPDGALAFLPFETLTRRGVPVLETVDIGYVQSLAVYAELKKRSVAKKRAPEPSLLSVADPQYAPPLPGTGVPGSSSLRGLEALSWPLLPGTRKESAAIAGLYRDNRQLLGAEASKSSLADLQTRNKLKGFQILHFATHGYVDDKRSALVLSSGPKSTSAYLLDQDIVGWDLDSDLVLLSACNTGIGRQQKGEGVVGLPYAFFMAGNINTLMSLWPVDDEGTATLIPAFMKQIRQGEDHVTALNNTKRAFARGDYGAALSNPRVWSAFVLYGVPLSGTGAANSSQK